MECNVYYLRPDLSAEQNGYVSCEVEKITGKSASTTWRYLKVLVDAGVIMPEGGTNKDSSKNKCYNLGCIQSIKF